MNWRKRAIAWTCITAVALSAVSCGQKPSAERKTTVSQITDDSVQKGASDSGLKKAPEKQREIFSELTVGSENSEFLADGQSAGKQYGDFIVHEDNTVTVMVDGKEVSFEEASEKTGCTLTENKDGSVSVRAPFQTSQVIVKSEKEFDSLGAADITETIKNHYLLTYSSPSEAYSAYQKLSEDENIEYAEPNQIMKSTDTGKINRIDSWGVQEIGIDDFMGELSLVNHDINDVVVAVIDSGIYYEHNLFKGRILDNGRNFVTGFYDDSELNKAVDDNGHGSHCAGIICSSTGENVKILPVKVMDPLGRGEMYDIYCGMMYAIENGAHIMNLSFGSYGKSHLMDEAVSAAGKSNVTVCAAAGNESEACTDTYSSVASIKDCVVVSSVDKELRPSEFSNYQDIDFAAPGEDILSVSLEGPDATVSMSGTSMAAPFVAACFANVLSYDYTLSPEEAYDIVKANAIDLCEPGYDDDTGWGMVNLKNFRLSTERNENVPVVPSVPGPERNTEKTSYESDICIINNGVLENFRSESLECLDLASMVEEGIIPEFSAVGEQAFLMSDIREIILPDSVKVIKDQAFAGCNNLEKVVTKAEIIGYDAFSVCTRLREFDDSNIKFVDSNAFAYCYDLETADFTGLTKISDFAFLECRNLKSESFSFDKITDFEASCFMKSGISGKLSLDSAVTISENAFRGTAIEEIHLNSNITVLPDNIFRGCSNLVYISAPGITEIRAGALALMKDGYFSDNMVKTDIDFSKVDVISEYGPFNGYVFDGPVSFDSYTEPGLDCFCGAYGESLSLPGVKYAEITGYTEQPFRFSTVYYDNAEEISYSPDAFSGAVVIGDSLKTIISMDDYSESENIHFYSDNPEVTSLLESQNISCCSTNELYIIEPAEIVSTFENVCVFGVCPGQKLKYTYTVTNRETGETVISEENSNMPLSFIPYTAGEYSIEITVFDLSENVIADSSFSINAVDDNIINELNTDEDYVEMDLKDHESDNNYDYDYGIDYDDDYDDSDEAYEIMGWKNNLLSEEFFQKRVFSFRPAEDGEYQICTNWAETDVYSSSGEHIHFDKEYSVKMNLSADSEYRIVFTNSNYMDILCTAVNSDGNHREMLKNVIDKDSVTVFCNPESENEVTAIVKTRDGRILEEGTDYTFEFVNNGYGESYYWLKATGKYFGYICRPYNPLRLLSLNKTASFTESAKFEFTPEESGIYSIIFTPESKQISEAVENNGYIRFYIPDYELSVTDSNNKEIPYSKIHPDKNIAYSGQSELKVYMEKGRHYRMIAGKNSNVTVSDKASLSQCKVSCKRNYAFNGKAVTPEISFEYDGKVLKEGTDYKLTVLNNTEPGIMFAIAEGTGNYCGFMNFAMAIEGGGVTCSEFNGMNVMDISTDQEFALENISKYRLTLDKDTWIKIESNISEWIGIDYYSIDDINEKSDSTYMYPDSDYILLKKGTWILTFDAFRDGTTETVIKAKLKTNDSIKSISDASVEITYNNETGLPDYAVFLDGKKLSFYKDYYLEYNYLRTEKPGVYSTQIMGRGEYQGEITVPYCIIPVSESADGMVYDGQCGIDMNETTKFKWIPQKTEYYISTTSYINCDIIITNENGEHVWAGTLNQKTSGEFKAEPGSTYYVYVTGKFSERFRLYLQSDGRLSDCTAEYEKYKVFDGDSSAPAVIFKDGDYVLTEGEDYILIDNGFINAAGRSEYVYRGTGKYFGEITLPVISYDEKISTSDISYHAVPGKVYSFENYSAGEKLLLKVTSDNPGKTLYSLKYTSDEPETSKYLSVILYDSEGKFLASGKDAENFVLSEGESAYVSITAPYFMDDINPEEIFFSGFMFKTETIGNDKETGSPADSETQSPSVNNNSEKTSDPENTESLKGDVNCDGVVNLSDLVILQKYLLGKTELSGQNLINASVNEKTESPTVIDYILIKNSILG